MKKWFVVTTYTGQERRVKENLERRRISMNIADGLSRVVIAEEKQLEIKNGKVKEVVKNIYPGNVFLEMEEKIDDHTWFVVRNTQGVKGFIGSSGKCAKPIPVKESEMDFVLRRIGLSESNVSTDFDSGDRVKILSGSFAGIEGEINSMNNGSQSASVNIFMFGRELSAEIDYVNLQRA